MRESRLTAAGAINPAYAGAMANPVTLSAKTATIQTGLLARGHELPRWGADGGWGHETADALLDELGLTVPRDFSFKIGLTDCQFAAAAKALDCTVAQIRAVDEVESGGGWFTDVRADILDLDGPGGFLDGPELPKILFEAHQFSKYTGGRFDGSHPNLSTAKWNRALYVGGEGEWARLYRAMLLDERAALLSASVGRYQIMGFNHADAGFKTVRAFWDAMKESEARHLEAFVAFIRARRLDRFLRQISAEPESCKAFALGYNGPGYHANRYHEKIARAFSKFSKGG
ncbi:N-acetylmuramidase family protein [Alteriqipengyuania flavescens]|uniref:N-acetylmuramidase family protein n=1 Tax=Alteriqipengyuania flavescens TaxID=3053610 RepID=UPI0025B43681|nr:N-acetylmuramidase family protein [Alteriqipengyuania flavescens]WJY18668.1 N-acetylmuramidase family protein [Alteriqipengyuania flavescens]WJY24608.1 N-acetylmuramidase family protein [Alteriqipengyuania flavescens]